VSKCKFCKKPASNRFGLHTFCDTECAYQFAIAAKEKAASKKQKEFNAETRQRKQKLKTRQEWLKDAQTVFNKFIRLRDEGLPCVSCGRPDGSDHQRHASHYKSRGAHPELALNEMNCHASCATCNNFLSGNLVPYRVELIKRIGLEKVEWLEGKHEPLKLTIEEIKELIAEYKQKIKQLSA
jgi:5-methylcytosine-specific restriction endonuclease McrA